MRYLFEDYALDAERRELHRGAHIVAVAPQAFDLLEYLIRNRERVLGKDDLISAVWTQSRHRWLQGEDGLRGGWYRPYH